MRKLHYLLADSIRRFGCEITAKNPHNPRRAIMVAQNISALSRAYLSWGRMHMQYPELRASRGFRLRGALPQAHLLVKVQPGGTPPV